MMEFFSTSTVEGFREVKETPQAALWLGGLEAITDGLRDSKDLQKPASSLHPSSCLG